MSPSRPRTVIAFGRCPSATSVATTSSFYASLMRSLIRWSRRSAATRTGWAVAVAVVVVAVVVAVVAVVVAAAVIEFLLAWRLWVLAARTIARSVQKQRCLYRKLCESCLLLSRPSSLAGHQSSGCGPHLAVPSQSLSSSLSFRPWFFFSFRFLAGTRGRFFLR